MTCDFREADLFRRVIPQPAKTDLGVLEYVETGDGPLVVAVHGAMGDPLLW